MCNHCWHEWEVCSDWGMEYRKYRQCCHCGNREQEIYVRDPSHGEKIPKHLATLKTEWVGVDV